MRIAGQQAFVLHARPWRETSLIVDLLTHDHGRIALVARGLRGVKQHSQRAALQPLQHVRADFVLRGEMGRLVLAEALDAAPKLQGDTLMAAFYVNELLMRLLPRHDGVPEIYQRYGELRAELFSTNTLAWTLRKFERDLLDLLGFGFSWDCGEDEQRLDPAARYRLDPQQGPVRDFHHAADTISGAALLALAENRQPPSEQLLELRTSLRGLLRAHLGGGTLKSWGLMADLAKVRVTRSEDR